MNEALVVNISSSSIHLGRFLPVFEDLTSRKLPESISSDRQLMDPNLIELDNIKKLPENWNNYGAKVISLRVVDKVKKILKSIDLQPIIFPSSHNSIQLEFHKINGDFLEIEIYEDRIEVFKQIDGIEDESIISDEEINGLIISFNH